jgi:hypothetical protein
VFSSKLAVDLPAETAPQLIVVIDTEEEFDWSKPVDRANTSVEHMEWISRCQDVFNEYQIKPCYVIDYPIVSQDAGCKLLKSFHRQGLCEIGAHLHPWVNPPYTETLIPKHTYPGNLPKPLEFEKLKNLKSLIDSEFQQDTTIYKAGRYGFGPNTEQILQQLGFTIDLSVCPPFDYRADGGPDYRTYNDRPFWFSQPKLLELPVTGAFVGAAGRYSPALFGVAQKFKRFKAPGILSKLGIVDRLMLSPEGFSSKEHLRLTRALYQQGSRIFTWSFHSPSMLPGHTVYVRNDAQLQQFIGEFRRFFDYFFDELKGQASTPTSIKALLEKQA